MQELKKEVKEGDVAGAVEVAKVYNMI